MNVTYLQRKSLIEFISNCAENHDQIQACRQYILAAIAELLSALKDDYQAIYNQEYDATKMYPRDLAERLLTVAEQYFNVTGDNELLVQLASVLDGYWALSLILAKNLELGQKRLEITEKNTYLSGITSRFSTETEPQIRYHLLCVKMSLECYQDRGILLAEVLNCLPNVTLKVGTGDIDVDIEVTEWLVRDVSEAFKAIDKRKNSHIYNQVALLKEIARRLQGCSVIKPEKKSMLFGIINKEVNAICKKISAKIAESDDISKPVIDQIIMLCYATVETLMIAIEKLDDFKTHSFIQVNLAFIARLGADNSELRAKLKSIRHIGQRALVKLTTAVFPLSHQTQAHVKKIAQETVDKLKNELPLLDTELSKTLTVMNENAKETVTLSTLIKDIWRSHCKTLSINRLAYPPIDIDKFFIDIIIDESEDDQSSEIENRDYLSYTKLVDIFNVPQQSDPSDIKALLSGSPGSGKSTLTDFLVHSVAKGLLWQDQWVIPVKLANITQERYPVKDKYQIVSDEAILKAIIKECISPLLQFISEKMNIIKENLEAELYNNLISAKENKKLIFILDGFDECEFPNNPHPIIKSLFKYPRIIVTSRPGYFPLLSNWGFEDAHRFFVKGFSRRGLENYVLTFFAEENKLELSQSLLSELQANNILQKLCRTPLYAELVCSLRNQEGRKLLISDIESSSSTLYKEIVLFMCRQYLIKTGQVTFYEVGVYNDKTIMEMCERLLKALAYTAYSLRLKVSWGNEAQTFNIKELVLDYLIEVDPDFKSLSIKARDKEVGKLLETSGFLIVMKGRGNTTSFSFCHQSLADYFAALFITEQYAIEPYKGAISAYLEEIKTNRNEEQLFWLIAGNLQREKNRTTFDEFIGKLSSSQRDNPDYLELLRLCCINEAQQLPNNFWEFSESIIQRSIQQLIMSYDLRLAVSNLPPSFLASRLRLNQWVFTRIYIDKRWLSSLYSYGGNHFTIRRLLQLIAHLEFASESLIDALLDLSITRQEFKQEITELLSKLASSSPRVYGYLLTRFSQDYGAELQTEILLLAISKSPTVDTLFMESLLKKISSLSSAGNKELEKLLISCLKSKVNYLVEQLLLYDCRLNWQVALFNQTIESLLKLYASGVTPDIPNLLANIHVQTLQQAIPSLKKITSYEAKLIQAFSQILQKVENTILSLLETSQYSKQITAALCATARYYQATLLERAIRKRKDLKKLLTSSDWCFERSYAPLNLSLETVKKASAANLAQFSQLLCYQMAMLHEKQEEEKLFTLLDNWVKQANYEALLVMVNELERCYQSLQQGWLAQWLEYGISSQLQEAFTKLPIESQSTSSVVINTLLRVQGSLRKLGSFLNPNQEKVVDNIHAVIWWILCINHRVSHLEPVPTNKNFFCFLISQLTSYFQMLTDSLLSARLKHSQQTFDLGYNAKETLVRCYGLLDSFRQNDCPDTVKAEVILCCLLIQILIKNTQNDVRQNNVRGMVKELLKNSTGEMKLVALKYILLSQDTSYSKEDISQIFKELWLNIQDITDWQEREKLLLTVIKLAKLKPYAYLLEVLLPIILSK